MNVLAHGLRLYVCPECFLTKMDAAQMPVHDRDCGGKFEAVEYVPAEQLRGAVEAERKRIIDLLREWQRKTPGQHKFAQDLDPAFYVERVTGGR